MTDVLVAFLTAHPLLNTVLAYAGAVCMLASFVDSSLPQPAPGSHWLPLRKLVSLLALNTRNARNVGQPPIRSWVRRVLMIAMKAAPAGSVVAFVATAVLAWDGATDHGDEQTAQATEQGR